MTTQSGLISGGGKQTLGAALGVPGTRARFVTLVGTGLIGGSDLDPGSASPVVHATGYPISATLPVELPLMTEQFDLYDFDNIYVYVADGSTVSVLYGQG